MARGRPRKNGLLRSFFSFDEVLKISICKNCRNEIPGDHLGNLTKHVFQYHRSVYDQYADDEDFAVRDAVPLKRRKITVEYDADEVQSNWLDLIVKEGRPFVILDSQALKNLLSPIFGALEIDMLTSRNVQISISLRAEVVMNDIQNSLKKRIFSLKIDSATRHNRRVICLNAQAVINGVIQIFTLALSEMNVNSGRHTAKNIKLFVLAILQKYDLKIEQIYSITQDNGRNFILAGKMLTYDAFQLRNESDATRENDSDEEGSDANSEDDDDEVDVVEQNAVSTHAMEEDPPDDDCVDWVDVDGDLEYVDEEATYHLLEEEESNLNEISGVAVMKCAAHTLALGVTDTVEKLKLKGQFKKFRKVAKFLRTPNQVTKLRSQKLSLPKMDVVVRWNSSYDLIHSMVKLQPYCSTAEFKQQCTAAKIPQLNSNDWKFAPKFQRVFKPPKICTKLLQGEQVTLSDFFKMWNELILRVKKLSSEERMAAELYKNLIKREESLLTDNEPLQAALYLDPRFRLIFTKVRPNYFNESAAQNYLFQLYKHVKKLETINASAENNTSATSNTNDDTNIDTNNAEDDKLLENYINDHYAEIDEDNHTADEDDSSAWHLIRNFKDKMPLSTNVLQYWYEKRFTNPLLYKLSNIVFGVPASQVSVERSFSVLKFILNDYRTRLGHDILQEIMLIRLN